MKINVTMTQHTLGTDHLFKMVTPPNPPEGYRGVEKVIFVHTSEVVRPCRLTGLPVKVRHNYQIMMDQGERRWRADHIELPGFGVMGRIAVRDDNWVGFWDTPGEAAQVVAAHMKKREQQVTAG